MKVLVGSLNPVKIDAVKRAFSLFFDGVEVIGMKVDSKVSSQPIGNETFDGAKNRALELKRIDEDEGLGEDFFVGIEGGIQKIYSRWFAFGCMCIMDREGNVAFGTSQHFELPKKIVDQLLQGVELGEVIDHLTGDQNTKTKGGAIGFFTKDVMDRRDLYVYGLIAALIPFLNQSYYFNE